MGNIKRNGTNLFQHLIYHFSNKKQRNKQNKHLFKFMLLNGTLDPGLTNQAYWWRKGLKQGNVNVSPFDSAQAILHVPNFCLHTMFVLLSPKPIVQP